MSKPISMALQHSIIQPGYSVFDYGCGKGRDVEELSKLGYEVTGFDPVYSNSTIKNEADIVNLGYVINVIEHVDERTQILKEAFTLSKYCLIVSAQVLPDNQKSKGTPYLDGILTTQNTFQRYYEQNELKEYIKSSLDKEPIAASPGIFYIFKNESDKESFIAERFSRKYIAQPRIYASLEDKLEKFIPVLEELANLIGNIGRIPKSDEIPFIDDIRKIGGLKKSIQYCEDLFDNFELETIQKNKKNNILVFLALSNFSGNIVFNNLPTTIKRDIKFFFNKFTEANELSLDLLYAVGDTKVIDEACKKSNLGKLLPDSLYVHTSYIDGLSPILRIFIGCGTVFAGDFSDATLVKINRAKSKISYLYYNDFDKDPHPKLLKSIVLDLSKLKMTEWDYSTRYNKPILHRKETFVGEDYPLYQQFKELTEAEERAGLYNTTHNIGYEKEWDSVIINYKHLYK